MRRILAVGVESFPIAGRFTISRGSKTEAVVVTCALRQGDAIGRGECVPYARYGESIESVVAVIESARKAVEEGIRRDALQALLPPGAARNALDCAMWDLEAKLSGATVPARLGVKTGAVTTAYTLSLGTAEEMAAQARSEVAWPLLKVKVGSDDVGARNRAVAAACLAFFAGMIGNEGWTAQNLEAHLAVAAECGVALIEQPLPAGKDDMLAEIGHPVPVCADESLHVAGDLARLRDRYDAVNIKLDKTGGLTEALRLRDEARKLGLQVMVGCMVGTSLAMAPAVILARGADFVDLDGPLLLARDRTPGLRYDGSLVYPPEPELWG